MLYSNPHINISNLYDKKTSINKSLNELKTLFKSPSHRDYNYLQRQEFRKQINKLERDLKACEAAILQQTQVSFPFGS